MTEQQEAKKKIPKKERKSLLHNPDRAKVRKESKKRMKEKMAPETKNVTPTRLEEVLK